MLEPVAMSCRIMEGGATIRSWSDSVSSREAFVLRVVDEDEPIDFEMNQ